MARQKQKKRRGLFIKAVFAFAFISIASGSLLQGCGTAVDSPESAATRIKELVNDTIQPTYDENQVRANIQLTKTNLLAMLPDLREYPIALNARDSGSTEAVEIFTSSEKAGQGRDGFYLELAQLFNQQRMTISNGKQAKVAIRQNGVRTGCTVYVGAPLYA